MWVQGSRSHLLAASRNSSYWLGIPQAVSPLSTSLLQLHSHRGCSQRPQIVRLGLSRAFLLKTHRTRLYSTSTTSFVLTQLPNVGADQQAQAPMPHVVKVNRQASLPYTHLPTSARWACHSLCISADGVSLGTTASFTTASAAGSATPASQDTQN